MHTANATCRKYPDTCLLRHNHGGGNSGGAMPLLRQNLWQVTAAQLLDVTVRFGQPQKLFLIESDFDNTIKNRNRRWHSASLAHCCLQPLCRFQIVRPGQPMRDDRRFQRNNWLTIGACLGNLIIIVKHHQVPMKRVKRARIAREYMPPLYQDAPHYGMIK